MLGQGSQEWRILSVGLYSGVVGVGSYSRVGQGWAHTQGWTILRGVRNQEWVRDRLNSLGPIPRMRDYYAMRKLNLWHGDAEKLSRNLAVWRTQKETA